MVLFMEKSRSGTVHMMDPVFFRSGKPHPCRVFFPRIPSPLGIRRCECYKKTYAYSHICSLYLYTIIDKWPVTQICDPECVSTMWPGNKPMPIGYFMLDQNGCNGNNFNILEKGSYNISFRLKNEHEATIIRLSQPGAAFFPEEKVMNEVATMRYLADKTSIPIPFIHHSGTKKESPLELSPFIIMDYVEHETNMLSQQIDDFTWDVTRRPLSMNMNELVRVGSLPQTKLPDIHTTYTTASSYLEALADLNLEHLIHQRNDSVDSADDCRRRFVARQLFCKLARDKRLNNPALDKGPFKQWCDDLRPANVLLHGDLKLAGVVDWEFTYAAPAEFSYAPPWWLLIEKPEYWSEGLEDWIKKFDFRLKTFLKVMKEHEDNAIKKDRLKENQRLSNHMRESWESGDFWVIYAVTHSFAFDAIYWQKIDPRFFGPTVDYEEAWRDRLDLLDEQERDKMEELVSRKLEEMESRVLAWDPDEYTMAFHQHLKERKVKEDEGACEGD
ncbi:phosphotransferase family protein [Aspergillus piperis CBS 112811]|uniref:Phosphotransferase family protein n=1 Tax=Aspergillus piperis CBS 112811 TaxID=1448313 RepID=A0A8G1R9L6_9EURO|nr:phosphotransferase family protein [Aspergillus piperis CBS 112811]RAH62094.1 phosphotransferase family protein [Aspergillus piperis CBS 112811]